MTESAVGFEYEDGQSVQLPLSRFPKLAAASSLDRKAWELLGAGEGVRWATLDERLSAEGVWSDYEKWLGGRIDKFIGVIRRYKDEIFALQFGCSKRNDRLSSLRRYRKILLFTVLETLAKARYPKEKSAGKAFSRLVSNYCDWPDASRVSLTHLVAALERSNDENFESLRAFASAQLSGWHTGAAVLVDRDPPHSEVEQRWPRDESGRPRLLFDRDGWTWKKFRHRNLLYAYRSKLSHESREPTFEIEDESDSPHYADWQMSERLGGVEWNLTYPVEFLAGLVENGIRALADWLRAEREDPYRRFAFGPCFYDELNDDGQLLVVNPLHP